MIQFSHIFLNEDYREKFRVVLNDFILLTKDNVPIRNTLYRKGNLFCGSEKEPLPKYFLLIKYQENAAKNYLESSYCILDNEGNEIKDFKNHLSSPYIVDNSILYKSNGSYYNILTDECYFERPTTTIDAGTHIIIEKIWDTNPEKRGIFILNKQNGSIKKIEEVLRLTSMI